jgi:hypothetical protein
MEKYIKWLENKIEVCLEDKDLQREHWAFCQALKKYRELALRQPTVIGSVCTCTKFRETTMINGRHICSICNKPIVQTDL